MGEVDELDDPVDHRVAKGDQSKQSPETKPIDEVLSKRGRLLQSHEPRRSPEDQQEANQDPSDDSLEYVATNRRSSQGGDRVSRYRRAP